MSMDLFAGRGRPSIGCGRKLATAALAVVTGLSLAVAAPVQEARASDTTSAIIGIIGGTMMGIGIGAAGERQRQQQESARNRASRSKSSTGSSSKKSSTRSASSKSTGSGNSASAPAPTLTSSGGESASVSYAGSRSAAPKRALPVGLSTDIGE